MNEKVELIESIVTWQGEGKNCGERMLLLRFKTCNRVCSYCDTFLKMRTTIESVYSVKDIQSVISKEKLSLMITGGEPTYDKHFNDTVLLLNKLSYPLANVETNGFRLIPLINEVKENKNVHYMYSPKMFSNHELTRETTLTEELKEIPNVFMKVVYETENDFIKEYVSFLSSLDINHRVFLMPEGTTRKDLFANAPEVFDACERYKFNFSSRDHIIYGFI